MLRTLLRFDPWVPSARLWCDPAVPPRLLPLRVDGLHLAGSAVTVSVDDDGWDLTGLPAGVELIRSPRNPVTADAPLQPEPGPTG
jgi:hypothetical protein